MWLIKGLGLGGAEQLLALAAPHVDRSRFDYEAAFLVPSKDALVGDLEKAGVRTTCLNQTSPFDPGIIGRIARFLRERSVDLLHVHLPYTGVVGRVGARLAGVPCVVYTEHNVQECYHPITRLANQLTIRLCDVTIAVSEEIRESLLRRPLARGARVLTIRNGVDTEGLKLAARIGPDVREEFSIARDRLVVGTVSGFRAEKRLDLWVEAARLIAEVEPRSVFILVGDGPLRPRVMALAERLGLGSHITFTGLRRDVPRLVAAFDIFMMSSLYEGLPVAVLEAMALGKPVVATRVGGLPGVVNDGQHGFLVEAGDSAALAAKALVLLGDPDLRRTMGGAGQARIQEYFSVQQMVHVTEQVYADVLTAASAAEERSLAERRAP